jgi:hypothetical protein
MAAVVRIAIAAMVPLCRVQNKFLPKWRMELRPTVRPGRMMRPFRSTRAVSTPAVCGSAWG